MTPKKGLLHNSFWISVNKKDAPVLLSPKRIIEIALPGFVKRLKEENCRIGPRTPTSTLTLESIYGIRQFVPVPTIVFESTKRAAYFERFKTLANFPYFTRNNFRDVLRLSQANRRVFA